MGSFIMKALIGARSSGLRSAIRTPTKATASTETMTIQFSVSAVETDIRTRVGIGSTTPVPTIALSRRGSRKVMSRITRPTSATSRMPIGMSAPRICVRTPAWNSSWSAARCMALSSEPVASPARTMPMKARSKARLCLPKASAMERPPRTSAETVSSMMRTPRRFVRPAKSSMLSTTDSPAFEVTET
jgi:hypothetical protein